jgi:hypothetical protein
MQAQSTIRMAALWVMALSAAALIAACGKPAGQISPAELPEADPALLEASRAEGDVHELFDVYLKAHAEKRMDDWLALFLPGAVAVEVETDGSSSSFTVAELARSISESAKTTRSQRETLAQVRIETHGGAGTYAARYTLFIDDENVQTGRAFFSLVKKDGKWRIAGLVWQVDSR